VANAFIKSESCEARGGEITMEIKERYFEEFEIGENRRTLGRTITEADIVAHAGQTGDFFPHHLDAVWCATQNFKRRMAHGTLIFSVGVGMTASTINPRAMSYGYDGLRFIKPVFIGDTIRASATIKDKRDHPRRASHGIVVEFLEVSNQDNENVLVCEHLYLVERRDRAFCIEVDAYPGQ
jgi:acyl dehydratase